MRFTKADEVGLQFIEHTLGLSEIRLAVVLACRKMRLDLEIWRDEETLKGSYDRVLVSKKLEAVLPDAYFAIRLPEHRLLYFFLEFDRGLDNLKFIQKHLSPYRAY